MYSFQFNGTQKDRLRYIKSFFEVCMRHRFLLSVFVLLSSSFMTSLCAMMRRASVILDIIPIPINNFTIDQRESAKNRKTQLALYCMNTMPVAFFDLLAALTRSIIDLLRNLGSVKFAVLLSRFPYFFRRAISTFVYSPPKKTRKLGQNNPQIRRTLGYARGLMKLFIGIGIIPRLDNFLRSFKSKNADRCDR